MFELKGMYISNNGGSYSYAVGDPLKSYPHHWNILVTEARPPHFPKWVRFFGLIKWFRKSQGNKVLNDLHEICERCGTMNQIKDALNLFGISCERIS